MLSCKCVCHNSYKIVIFTLRDDFMCGNTKNRAVQWLVLKSFVCCYNF